jgi:hypothetical protein
VPSWLACFPSPFPIDDDVAVLAAARLTAYLRSWQKAKKMMPAISATPAITPIAWSTEHATPVSQSDRQLSGARPSAAMTRMATHEQPDVDADADHQRDSERL